MPVNFRGFTFQITQSILIISEILYSKIGIQTPIYFKSNNTVKEKEINMIVPPDTPTCRIKGIIKNVKFEDRQTKSTTDVTEPYLPGRQQWLDIPAQFRLTVQIQEVTYISGSENRETCKERYKIGDEDILFIYQSLVKDGDDFQEGRVIIGEVWNGYFNSYSLSSP